MKTFRVEFVIVLCLGILFSTTSCLVLVEKDNGRHRGWHNNSNNPHNPNSTNPKKSKGNPKR